MEFDEGCPKTDLEAAFDGMEASVKNARRAVGSYMHWNKILEQYMNPLPGSRKIGIPYIPMPGTLDGIAFTTCDLDVLGYIETTQDAQTVVTMLQCQVKILQLQAHQAVAMIANHYSKTAATLTAMMTEVPAPVEKAKRKAPHGQVNNAAADLSS